MTPETNKIIVDQDFLDANPGLVLDVGDEYELPTDQIIEHVITNEDLDNNPGLDKEVEVGDVVELEMGDEPIEETVILNSVDIPETHNNEDELLTPSEVENITKPIILDGKEVTQVTSRIVNGREIKVFVLSDGSRVDIADSYYEMLIKEQN